MTKITFLDWDDTLLATSALTHYGFLLGSKPPTGEIAKILKLLEESTINLITLLLTRGEVIIVTNAEDRWVQMSAAKWMPKVATILSKVSIISARSTYRHKFPDSPLKWKFHAFHEKLTHILSTKDPNNIKHVISFGDSHVEREAIRAVTQRFPNVIVKSLKFIERPSMGQLYYQHGTVIKSLDAIFNSEITLDLQLTLQVSLSPSSGTVLSICDNPNSVVDDDSATSTAPKDNNNVPATMSTTSSKIRKDNNNIPATISTTSSKIRKDSEPTLQYIFRLGRSAIREFFLD